MLEWKQLDHSFWDCSWHMVHWEMNVSPTRKTCGHEMKCDLLMQQDKVNSTLKTLHCNVEWKKSISKNGIESGGYWQLIVGWGTDSSNAEVLDFTNNSLHYYCVLQSSELSQVKFWEWYFSDFVFLIILFQRSAESSILTEVSIMLGDYFKTHPGVKGLPWLGIEPLPPRCHDH